MVDEIMERAETALRRSQWFEAERLAHRAMEISRSKEDFGLLARVILPLQEARRLRLAALRRESPVAVMCREPLSMLRLCPVVAIGQMTIRARIDPPKNWDKPDHKWFGGAMEKLGDAAIEMLDTGLELDRQIDFLMAALDSVPDHEKLHQALEALCKQAAKGFVRSNRPRMDELDAEVEAAGPELEAELGLTRKKTQASDED